MKIDSIVIYRSFINAMRKISDPEERCRAYDAMFDYGFDHIEEDLDNGAGIALEIIKPLLDQQFRKKMVNSANGRKGGRRSAISGEEPEVNVESCTEETEINRNKANESELKRIKAKKSEIKRKKANESELKPNVNVNDNVNVNVNDNANGNNKRFTPPTIEEVEAYCALRHNNVDPKAFMDYFSAGNWIDAKGQKVKNWKQKILTWERYQPKPADTLPVYDISGNTTVSAAEEEELLRLMKGNHEA